MPHLYTDGFSLVESPCGGAASESWTETGAAFRECCDRDDCTRQALASPTCPASQETTGRGQYDIVQFDKFRFLQFMETWHTERGITSSMSEMTGCKSYLNIIGMGEAALPLILAQLEREGDDPDHWFAALEAITGEDPVSEDACGDTVRMSEEWLSWARKNNVG